jgi:hypothetical protein
MKYYIHISQFPLIDWLIKVTLAKCGLFHYQPLHIYFIYTTNVLNYKGVQLRVFVELNYPGFGVVRHVHLLKLSVFVCLRPVFCVPNVANVSGMSILDCHFGFSNVYFIFFTWFFFVCGIYTSGDAFNLIIKSLWFLLIFVLQKTFRMIILDFQICWPWANLMKVIPETRRVH